MLLWGTAYSRSYLHIGAWSFYKSIFFLLYDKSLVEKSPLHHLLGCRFNYQTKGLCIAFWLGLNIPAFKFSVIYFFYTLNSM